jgi:hypothetical protein
MSYDRRSLLIGACYQIEERDAACYNLSSTRKEDPKKVAIVMQEAKLRAE